MLSFLEKLLISMIGERLSVDPGLSWDVRRGVEAAMATTQDESLRLRRLAETLKRVSSPSSTAVLDLWQTPLEPLWVRAALKKVCAGLLHKAPARLVVVGLAHNVKHASRKTAACYRELAYWQGFMESQLMALHWKNLEIAWVG
jgi:hypothetical protein